MRGSPVPLLDWADSRSLPDRVYAELVSTLFTMTVPIAWLGFLYVSMGVLILLQWHDWPTAALTLGALATTIVRLALIRAYYRAGGDGQLRADLRKWERRYLLLTALFAVLLSLLVARSLALSPGSNLGTVSLVFVFGAGVVSRNACRPWLCFISIGLAAVLTSIAMVAHAARTYWEGGSGQFYLVEAALLCMAAVVSLASVRHLYEIAVGHLTTKHELAQLARFDHLTGLPNRLLLNETCTSRLANARRNGAKVAIHYLDLDGFKAINDSYGHPAGDQLLIEVARRLRLATRAGTLACRVGGDEFILVQGDLHHRDEAHMLARRVIRQLSGPYLIDGTEMHVSVSMGVALAPDHGDESDMLIARADAALYTAKACGKAQIRFYEPETRRVPPKKMLRI